MDGGISMLLHVCKLELADKDRLLAKIPEHILEACMYKEIGEYIYLIGTVRMVFNIAPLLVNCYIYKRGESNILDIDTMKYLDEIEKQE